MSQPVTTNPLIIMLINMTVVFCVLIALGFVISLIHMIDPTKPKQEPKAEPAAPALVAEQAAPAAPAVAEGGVTPEVVAVIAAALASYGYGASSIRAIRPLARTAWQQAGRARGLENSL